MSNIHALYTSKRTAFREKGASLWIITEGQHPDPPLGVQLALPWISSSDPETESALSPTWLSFPPFSFPRFLLIILPLLVILSWTFRGPAFSSLPFNLLTLGDLGWAWIGAILAWTGLNLWECIALAGDVRGSGGWRLTPLGPRPEQVMWRLSPSWLTGIVVLLGDLVLAGEGMTFTAVSSMGVGISSIAIAKLLWDLYPLRSSPGSCLLEKLTGEKDLPQKISWSLRWRFLPIPLPVPEEGSFALGASALATIFWFSLVALTLKLLSLSGHHGLTLAGFLWQSGLAVLVVLYIGFLAIQLLRLFREGWNLHRATLRHVVPTPEVQQIWETRSSLLTHIPELKFLPWCWQQAPPGTLLIRQGDTDRVFYWIARGEVAVIIRTEKGDFQHLATFKEGCGVGEIGFLEGRPRTAFVVVRRRVLVASISWDEAAPYLSDDQKDRLRQVVLASQAMENTPIFRLLPPEQKEVWITKGTPVVYSPGEIIMEEGEKQRWIGLVVTGKVSVYKQGKELAQLSPREVIGEMAYLTGEPRAATIVAQAPVLIWRWEPHWLDTTLGRTPLHLALEDLARSRRNGHETR